MDECGEPSGSRRADGKNVRVQESSSGRGMGDPVPKRIRESVAARRSVAVCPPLGGNGLPCPPTKWHEESMQSPLFFRALGCLMLLVFASCGDSRSAQPVYDFASADQIIEGFLTDNPDLEGAGLIIVDREWGVVHHRAFGAFGLDRISLVASSSKMVTAGILNRLADDGLLDLNQPLQDFLGWEGTYPDVTTAQLLSNSSGLVGLFPDPAFGPYVCQYLYTGTLLECGKAIFTSTRAANDVLPPETTYRYGGGQWQVAGAVAEAVSEKSWAALFEEIYTEPCELESSGFNNHFVQLPSPDLLGYPAGFEGDPDNLMPTQNPNMEGGLYTTTGDYGKLLLMQLRGGRCDGNFVMSESSVQRMQTNQIGEVWGGTTGSLWNGYGYGWWVDTEREGWVTDPGAYGSVPWLDLSRGYGGMLIIEGDSGLGTAMALSALTAIEEAIDNPS